MWWCVLNAARKKLQTKITLPAKLSFRNEGEKFSQTEAEGVHHHLAYPTEDAKHNSSN